MAEMATLGFGADTSQLKAAKADLQALVPAAAAAENAAQELAGAMDQDAAAATRAATATKQTTASADAAAGALNRGAQAARNFAGANDNAAAAALRSGAAMKSGAMAANNMMFQVQDIGVQLISGQSPFMIAVQQVSQMNLGMLGVMGTLRALGSAFMGILSPINLLAIAVVTLGGTAISYFMEWISSGEEANNTVKKQHDLIAGVAEKWGEAIPQIKAYNDELVRQKELGDLIAASKIINTEQLKEVGAIFEEISGWTADFSKAVSGEAVTALTALETQFQELYGKVQDGTATQEDFNKTLTAAKAASDAGAGGLDFFISKLGEIVGAVAPALAAVNKLNNAVAGYYANPLGTLSPVTSDKGEFVMPGNESPVPYNVPTPGGRPLIELDGLPGEFGSGKKGGGAAGIKEAKTALQELNEELQKINAPFNQAKTAYSTLEQAMKNGVISNDQYTASLKQIQDAFLAAGGTSDQWAQIMKKNTSEVGKSMESLAKGALTDLGKEFVDLMVDGKANFEDLAKSVIKSILDMVWQIMVVEPIMNALKGWLGGIGGGGSDGGIMSVFANADGNAFNSGGVQKFAKGGSFTNSVVDTPTLFAFANGGKMGVMGEAGPEAILPLKRGSDGKLGVQMTGGGSGGKDPVVVQMNIINNAGATVTKQERTDENGQKTIDVMIDEAVAGKIAQPGSNTRKAMQNNFNVGQPLARR